MGPDEERVKGEKKEGRKSRMPIRRKVTADPIQNKGASGERGGGGGEGSRVSGPYHWCSVACTPVL